MGAPIDDDGRAPDLYRIKILTAGLNQFNRREIFDVVSSASTLVQDFRIGLSTKSAYERSAIFFLSFNPIKVLLVISELVMSSQPRILLVGREAPITRLRKQILEQEGYCVTVTDNFADDSLLHLQAVAFDVVVLDYSIPEKQRRAVAAKIRKHHPRMPILAIFRYPGEYDRTPTRIIYSLDGPEAMLQVLREIFMELDGGQPGSSRRSRTESRGF